MKSLVTFVLAAVILTGCGQSAPQAQTAQKTNQAQNVANTPAKTTSLLPTLDGDERASIKQFATDTLYKGKTEEEIYSDVMTNDMHYLCIAFLEMFPASAKKTEVEKKLTHFRQFLVPTNGPTVLTYQELKDRFNWDGKETVYRWASSMSGKVREGGKFLWFGPMCLGNLQFRGTWTFEQDGMHFPGGGKIIYSTVKSAAPEKEPK